MHGPTVASSADLVGDVTVGVASSADLAGDATVSVASSVDLAEVASSADLAEVASSADLAGDVTVGVPSSADPTGVVTAGVALREECGDRVAVPSDHGCDCDDFAEVESLAEYAGGSLSIWRLRPIRIVFLLPVCHMWNNVRNGLGY